MPVIAVAKPGSNILLSDNDDVLGNEKFGQFILKISVSELFIPFFKVLMKNSRIKLQATYQKKKLIFEKIQFNKKIW